MAYIDQIVRVNRTVSYGPKGSQGLLKGEKSPGSFGALRGLLIHRPGIEMGFS